MAHVADLPPALRLSPGDVLGRRALGVRGVAWAARRVGKARAKGDGGAGNGDLAPVALEAFRGARDARIGRSLHVVGAPKDRRANADVAARKRLRRVAHRAERVERLLRDAVPFVVERVGKMLVMHARCAYRACTVSYTHLRAHET